MPEVEQQFHKSDEWHQYEEELMAVAEQQAQPRVAKAKAERAIPGIAEGAIRMNLPSRFEIEKYANEIFRAGLEGSEY